ncbi:uncharacterized protein [Epargyreus clarus]|uniref:uncharacterized protein n=1 Tax=Epargyreus clarus TaxID=520877 RepID=UPI003C2C2074
MFASKTVYWLGIISTLAIICQMCYSTSDVSVENVYTDKIFEVDLEPTLDSPVADVIEESEENPVKFVTSSTIAKSEERQDFENDLVNNWITEILSGKEKQTKIERPFNQKRVTRQSHSGYPLYPTLPTNPVYGNYGPYNSYNPNNATNSYSHGLPPNVRLNTTNPVYYNYHNFTRPGTTNFSASVQNPYKYPIHNGKNMSYPQYNNNPVNPGATYNSGYPHNRPASNYSANPYFPQPTPRPFHQGVPNNQISPTYPTTRPYYPGSVYPGTSNNRTYPGFIQTTIRPPYTGANNMNPSYPQSTSRSNIPTNPQMPYNRTNAQNPQSPIYPGAPNNVLNPGYPGTYPGNRYNSTLPTYGPRPQYNVPTNSSPYNSQNGNRPYNPNYNANNSSSPYGRMPGSQHPSYNNNGPYNSWAHQSQGYGQTSLNKNLQANNTAYNPLGDLIFHNPNSIPPGYTPNTPSPNTQYFGNAPNGPNPQNNPYSGYPSQWNNQHPSPNQYNAGSERRNFFYPPQTNGSSYDPRKNPPEHFSYPH